MKKIGMRNFKTAISVFLCIIAIDILNNLKVIYTDSPFYACIAAVICMQSSVFDSFTVGKNRMIGTFIGALLGLIFAIISPNNIILISLGIMIVIYICNIFGYKKSITIGCIVFIAIMVNLKNTTPVLYSTYRLIETFIGILISVIVNYVVFPPKYIEQLCEMKNTIYSSICNILKSKLDRKETIPLAELNTKIDKLESLLKSYISEIIPKREKIGEIDELKHFLNLSKKAYSHLCMLESLHIESNINEDNLYRSNKLLNTAKKSCDYKNSHIDIVYNYHISNILNIIETLQHTKDKSSNSSV